MTSNLGSEYILDNEDNANELVMNELKNTFRPELINRIDEIIVFNSLKQDVIGEIVDKVIKELNDRLQQNYIRVEITNTVREKIIEQLSDYEQILLETIKKIKDKRASEYIMPVRQHYARLRYGNAIDTQNKILIRKYFKELKRIKRPTLREFGLYIKKMVFR